MNHLQTDHSHIQNHQQLLLKKKALLQSEHTPNVLRNIIKLHQQQYKQSKPFSKKYGTQNSASKASKEVTPQSRQSHQNKLKTDKQIGGEYENREQKNSTKQTFSKKLNNNIIKDEQQPVPSSKQSYRIKKVVENRSPKKIRDELIAINEQEQKLQLQILQLHKKKKGEIEQVIKNYKIPQKKIADLLSGIKDSDQKQINWQQFINLQLALDKLDILFKNKSKSLAKIEQKITTNSYVQYIQSLPQDIDQIPSSEEDDIVAQLPPERPKLDANSGSYSITMTNIKHKNYALNLRRTYDVFKNDDDKNVNGQQKGGLFVKEEDKKEEMIKQEGQNRMTLNNKFKNFLLD